MSLLAIFLIIISAAIHVGWNFLTKSSANPKVFSLMKGSVIIGISAILLFGIPLHVIPRDVWFFIFLSGTVHALYILALSSAYETGDISYVYPVARSAPAFVPIAAFITFGERISAKGGVGILIVVICIFVMQLRGEIVRELKSILILIRKKDSLWAFVTLATVITYSIIDKAGMVAFNQVENLPPGMHALIYILLEASFCYFIYWGYMWAHHEIAAPSVWKREWPWAILAAVGSILSYSLILHVMKTQHLSYIVALRHSSVLFATLVGWIILKEKYGRVRLITSVIMLLGLFLVATSK